VTIHQARGKGWGKGGEDRRVYAVKGKKKKKVLRWDKKHVSEKRLGEEKRVPERRVQIMGSSDNPVGCFGVDGTIEKVGPGKKQKWAHCLGWGQRSK